MPLCRALKQSDIRIKCDNKNQLIVLYFQYKGTFSESKRLMSLNLSGTKPGEPCTRPLSCTTPWQLALYVSFTRVVYTLLRNIFYSVRCPYFWILAEQWGFKYQTPNYQTSISLVFRSWIISSDHPAQANKLYDLNTGPVFRFHLNYAPC